MAWSHRLRAAVGWLDRLCPRRHPELSPEQASRIAAWRKRPEADCRFPLDMLRWVVVDVETSGLDVARDRLLSLGAVAVKGHVLVLADSVEVVLRQEQVSSTANILVHGIGETAQRSGEAPADALLRFLTYTGKDPLAGFHAAFDVAMIARALRRHLGIRWAPRVIDLADLLPALFPEASQCRQLDDWLARHGIAHPARHQALADAYATAQLLQVALVRAAQRGIGDFAGLDRLQREQQALWRLSGR